ncbi:HNH endonuclease family protein [Streptomyces sp. ISL-11]|uniref:HNH endonuclease family protein n=1 Tax=Streptomyces sp. ISL-11 TaxID=2819174 RepID=UPI001BE68658|nr:HNH endonuclease family protein [Streptomyces sp. ISL-11]MBT2386407.1 HNH endonuclease [Streptomyces sp. ISL-11]
MPRFTPPALRTPATRRAAALALAALLAAAGCSSGGDGKKDGEKGDGAKGSAGSALKAVSSLDVKKNASKEGYTRSKFGQAWADTDGNRCGTRDDILKRDLTGVEFGDGRCQVTSGTLAKDPYTGKSVKFERGSSKIDIDHVVALSDAWQKGAAQWPDAKRVALANDPLNLIAADASANRSKGDGDAAAWLPDNKAYRCDYIAQQVAVKKKYGLWVTGAEKDAMVKVLSSCPTRRLPSGGNPTEAPARFTTR